MSTEITIPLPDKVYVVAEASVGVSFYEEGDPMPLVQHPRDCDAIRKMVWKIWRKRHET